MGLTFPDHAHVMASFTPSLKNCQPPQPHHNESIAAFDALPGPQKLVAVAKLREVFRASPAQTLAVWGYEYGAGLAVGSDDLYFHFGTGMAVRNALRDVVRDEQLPTGNWDDYYYGALVAAIREEINGHE